MIGCYDVQRYSRIAPRMTFCTVFVASASWDFSSAGEIDGGAVEIMVSYERILEKERAWNIRPPNMFVVLREELGLFGVLRFDIIVILPKKKCQRPASIK